MKILGCKGLNFFKYCSKCGTIHAYAKTKCPKCGGKLEAIIIKGGEEMSWLIYLKDQTRRIKYEDS